MRVPVMTDTGSGDGGQHRSGATRAGQLFNRLSAIFKAERSLRAISSTRYLTTIKSELVTDERLKLMARAMQKHFGKCMRELAAERHEGAHQHRLTTMQGELRNVADVGFNEALSAKLETLTQGKKRLQAEMRTARGESRL